MLTKNQRLVLAFGGWALLTLAILVLLNSLDIEYFFVLCLIGFLIIVELSGPFTTKPKWRSRVNIVILAGVAIFALIVVRKVLEIIAR
ncbi:hypothetical protein [Methanocella arvoryzae]|uniref:Uncharacterized protein n=1 Tax=Methanocella arvoryzae (strain DSM 22066 / NBRC 105507 / MRE50) TaxID=351160 RepID=Q0W4E4_METAR|nr:hypothetical protein [Methanocella arvoryzae]CAJ36749.1 conserved hypothetical protein [Methanocella arvoryzae MRE50]